MSGSVADVSVTVESSMDKWLMDRVPWALWFCLAGLAVARHADSHGENGAALAGVYLALLGLAFAGWAVTTLLERSVYPFYVVLPIVFLVTILVIFVIALIAAVGGSGRGSSSIGRPWWGRLVNPPTNVFGRMLTHVSPCQSCSSIPAISQPGRRRHAPLFEQTELGVMFLTFWFGGSGVDLPSLPGDPRTRITGPSLRLIFGWYRSPLPRVSMPSTRATMA